MNDFWKKLQRNSVGPFKLRFRLYHQSTNIFRTNLFLTVWWTYNKITLKKEPFHYQQITKFYKKACGKYLLFIRGPFDAYFSIDDDKNTYYYSNYALFSVRISPMHLSSKQIIEQSETIPINSNDTLNVNACYHLQLYYRMYIKSQIKYVGNRNMM